MRPRALPEAALVALAVALRLPTLRVERLGDDWYHLSMIEGTYPVPRGLFDLFNFVEGRAGEVAPLVSRGVFPWWTNPGLALDPWRPLTSLTLHLDHALWGRGTVGPHAVSLALWGLVLVAASRWLGAVLPRPAALAALAVLALEESVAVPLAWIANRAALLAALFGLLGASSLRRLAASPTRRDAAVAAAMFSCAVASGEYGLASVGAAVAFELALRDGSLRARARGLWTALAPTLVYAALWAHGGHGSRGTSGYVDPTGDPGAWLSLAARQLPVFVAELVAAVPIDLGFASPLGVRAVLGVVALLAGVALWAGDVASRRVAFASACATAASLLPVLGAPAQGRVLFAAAWPFAALAGALVACALRAPSRGRAWASRVAVALALLPHVTAAPMRAWSEVGVLAAWRVRSITWRALPGVNVCRAPDADHVLVGAAGFGMLHVAPLLWQSRPCTRPRTWRVLSAPEGVVRVVRAGPRQLELRGASVVAPYAWPWRGPRPFVAGEVVEAAGFRAEVLAADGQVQRVAFTFERDLDDARVVLWVPTADGFAQVRPPPMGAAMDVPVSPRVMW